MPYSTESQVLEAAGLTSARIQIITGLSSSDVTTMISNFIAWADQTIQDWVRLPMVVRRELHLGDGESDQWDLGPEDEDYSIEYDPTGDVQNVYAIYYRNRRKKLPYPKDDCDLGTENESSSWSSDNCTLSDVTSPVVCGTYALQGVFSAAGYMEYPSGQDLNRNIDIFNWIAFQFRTSDASQTYTIRLYDRSGNFNSYDFTVHQASVWYVIMVKIDDFSGSVNWNNEHLYYLQIRSGGGTPTVQVDNLNFNDGVMWAIPQGDIYHMHQLTPIYSSRSGTLPNGYDFYVTYSFDPFNTTVPANIAEASACLAGVKIYDYLLGRRVEVTGFIIQADEGAVKSDKFSMEITRSRLLKRAKELVGQYGYGFDSGTI